ncbi:hypothetical protein B0H13DRAFT_2526053 [Mycena leptocephala]|nr:hypothetical protein B0H13DRAFT_2526053 [Mycena leptocephala]
MASTKDFRVAIVGGGMCGLACAVGLARFGIKAQVFEATPKFDEVGAGVGLGHNALRALKGLGILDAVLARGDDALRTERRMLFVSGLGEHEEVYDYNNSSDFAPNETGIAIYRPTFLEAVLPLVDPKTTHFHKRCTSISTSASGVHCLHFADGTQYEAELVIGADGIKSTTRGAVVGTENNVLQFTNTVAYRGLVSTETLKQDGLQTDLGKRICNFIGIDKHIIVFPIKAGEMINIVAFVTDNSVPVGSVEDLLDSYAGWGPDVMIMLKQLKTPSKWSIHQLEPSRLMFEAKLRSSGTLYAHAMTPHLGSGVGQGFEDVFVLSQLLGHPSTNLSNLEDVLKAYDAVRRPRANMVLARSLEAGVIYESYDEMGGHLAGIWEPIWRHDIDGDVASAIASLEKQGSFTALPTRV